MEEPICGAALGRAVLAPCRHGAIKPKRIRNVNLDLLITKKISRAREVPELKKSKKFPAVRQETLSSDRPVLDDASNGNIIDFYGSCSEDSCGMDQVRQQKREAQHREGASLLSVKRASE